MPYKHNNALEYRLFLMACMLSMFVSFSLFLLDTFITKELDSAVVGAGSFLIFSFFFYQVRYKRPATVLLMYFNASLILIVNVAWFTGGGLNITNAFVFFLVLLLITAISPTAQRRLFLTLVFINLTVFISLEFFYPAYSVPLIKNDRLLVINSIVLFLAFGIATYIMVFLKKQYNREREKVNAQNLRLDASNSEIEAQNEELIQYQEEIMAQRDSIEKKNKKLQQQAEELEKANRKIKVINESLEEKVNERTRKLLDLNNDLDLLVYRSSHDFRRPLTTLMGLNEIARLTIKDAESQELFDKVNDTAMNMDKMLLKFFMLYDVNHFRTTYENNTLKEIIDKLDKNLIARKKNITFNRKISTKKYQGKDERNRLIEIILENLVENSLIFNRKDKVIIDLNIIEKNGTLHISEEDNGNGIPSPWSDKVFDLYFRGSSLSTGNGLGLFVVKRAADLLNATVKLRSKEGLFTRFEISFEI